MDKPRVKPLVWERLKGIQTDFKAKCIVGTYLVECFDDGDGDYYVWALEWGKIEGHKMQNAAEAKAAAQADYEARILAALEPVTVQEAARVLLGDGINVPIFNALDPYNNDVDVWKDVEDALRALAERGE